MEHDEEIQLAEMDGDVMINGDDEMQRKKNSGARASRKRTKTGCLTCRRRRIKCGEERPRCGNCIKSKRQCEGYNQRVIFKEPVNSFRYPSSGGPITSVSRAEPSISYPSASRFQFQPPPPHPGSTLPRNDTKPNYPSDNQEIKENTAYGFLGPTGRNNGHVFDPSSAAGEKGFGATTYFNEADSRRPSDIEQADGRSDPQAVEAHHKLNTHVEFEFAKRSGQDQGQLAGQWSNHATTQPDQAFQERFAHSHMHGHAPSIHSQPMDNSLKRSMYAAHGSSAYTEQTSNSGMPQITLIEEAKTSQVYDTTSQNVEKTPQVEWDIPHENQIAVEQNLRPVSRDRIISSNRSTTHYWSNHSDDEDDDDPYDVTDDEMQEEEHLRKNDLGIVVALQAAQDRQDQSLRTYHSFIDGYGPDVLANYQPSARSSPLNDSMAARIFCHFINVTAPCISMFERHPANPSLIFQGRPVPKSQQHIWTYTMPTLALSNPALLQAILALGSLHMAKLQDGPIMAPLKHYHLAIRRIGKAVGLPTHRSLPAILAATMLLGWFETMSSDHSKWTGHVLGARMLLQGIDFSGMTRYLKTTKMRLRQTQIHGQSHVDTSSMEFEDSHHDYVGSLPHLPQDDDVNESLVGILMGKKLQYDQYGEILEDINAPRSDKKVYTQRDIETYEIQRDLFWWYCKQDFTQSILGGTKLLMPYDLWSHCPPRAAVGRRDAIYGTWDHLSLLLGRVAEYSANDLRRKRSAMKAGMRPPGGETPEGGPSGRRPPGPGPSREVPLGREFSGGEGGALGGRGPPSPQGPHLSGMAQLPSFAGMLPTVGGKVSLPRGFSPPREESPDDANKGQTLEEQTHDALEEWQEIHSAFNTLRDNFGPDYQALGPEYSQPIQTPFGPALQYRTFSIAGVWMSYYLGLIVLHRAHPFMPPAAMAAVGAAARQTGHYANEIGRIAAAIAPNASEIQQVSTGIGAALIESAFPLFVAGVQFQDSAQRSWTIRRCFDMRRLTGWQTGHSVAIGCETSWKKAAELGRGPSYTRGPEWQIPSTALDLPSRREQIRLGANVAQSENSTNNTQNRVHYALGLLAVESDLGNLGFHDRDSA